MWCTPVAEIIDSTGPLPNIADARSAAKLLTMDKWVNVYIGICNTSSKSFQKQYLLQHLHIMAKAPRTTEIFIIGSGRTIFLFSDVDIRFLL